MHNSNNLFIFALSNQTVIIMTRQEALNTITLDTQKIKEELVNRIVELNKRFYDKDGRVDVREFEAIIIDIIRYKWMKFYPETFLTCHVTGEEYNKTPKSAYSHYMKVINGRLDEYISLNALGDIEIYRDGNTEDNRKELYKKRLKAIEKFMDDDTDIIMWCVQNVSI